MARKHNASVTYMACVQDARTDRGRWHSSARGQQGGVEPSHPSTTVLFALTCWHLTQKPSAEVSV